MPRFPVFSGYVPPFQYYRPYNYRPRTPISQPMQPIQEMVIPELHPPQKPAKQKQSDTVWFDLFGIKLYFDDVLILSLLLFLYKEKVKDEGLFFALVLLLIS